jgi:hypothetical protein
MERGERGASTSEGAAATGSEGRGTAKSEPPAGPIGHAVAGLFGEERGVALLRLGVCTFALGRETGILLQSEKEEGHRDVAGRRAAIGTHKLVGFLGFQLALDPLAGDPLLLMVDLSGCEKRCSSAQGGERPRYNDSARLTSLTTFDRFSRLTTALSLAPTNTRLTSRSLWNETEPVAMSPVFLRFEWGV